MKITITIEMDENDLEIKAKETERKPVNKASEYARFFLMRGVLDGVKSQK